MSGRFCEKHSSEGLKQHRLLYDTGDIVKIFYKTKCDFCEEDAAWLIT